MEAQFNFQVKSRKDVREWEQIRSLLQNLL